MFPFVSPYNLQQYTCNAFENTALKSRFKIRSNFESQKYTQKGKISTSKSIPKNQNISTALRCTEREKTENKYIQELEY